MKEVIYCDNSTITEAWAMIIGFPAKIDEEEVAALSHFSKKVFGDLARKRSLILMEKQGEISQPFWDQQIISSNETILSRIGHQYLSIHYLQQGKDRYQKYEESLKPFIERWLEIYQDVLIRSDENYLIDRIGFGYVNTFLFNEESFDLSKYFKLNIGLDIETPNDGILDFETSFRLGSSLHNADILVNLSVISGFGEGNQLQLQTRISSEIRVEGKFTFKQKENILEELDHAKKIAKDAFFSFATEETHKAMEAKYADG